MIVSQWFTLKDAASRGEAGDIVRIHEINEAKMLAGAVVTRKYH